MRRRLGVVVALAAVGLMGLPTPVALADPVPSLFLSESPLMRGFTSQVFGDNFTPGVSYTLAADYGMINSTGSGAEVVADAAGGFDATFTMSTDVPADVGAAMITVTDDQAIIVVTKSVDVAQPYLGGGACPGQPIGDINREDSSGHYPAGVMGIGFAPGSYTLSSDSVTFTEQTVLASQGSLEAAGVAVPGLPEIFPVTVTLQQSPFTSWTWIWARGIAQADTGDRDAPWALRITGNCFAPGETVTLSHGKHISLPASLTASPHGRIMTTGVLHPAPQPASSGAVTLTGETSGQTASTIPYPIPGTTVLAGKALAPGDELISPRNRFTLILGHECHPLIYKTRTDGSSYETWELPIRGDRVDEGCRLIVRTDGNLVLRSGNGHVRWSAQTDRTGHGNYLRMRADGNLTLFNAQRQPLWTALTGVVRSRHAMGEGQLLARGQSLATGDARLTLRRNGNLVVLRSGTRVWQSHTANRAAIGLKLTHTGALRLMSRSGRVVWSTHTIDGGNHSYLAVRANGDVQLRDDQHDILWHTHTGT